MKIFKHQIATMVAALDKEDDAQKLALIDYILKNVNDDDVAPILDSIKLIYNVSPKDRETILHGKV